MAAMPGPRPGPGGGPPALAAALLGAGGPGGPPGPGPGPLPPGLGPAGPGPGLLGPGGPGPGPLAPGPPGLTERDAITALHHMMEAGKVYMDAEPDHEDKAMMAQILTTLQKLLAKDQKDQQDVAGGNTTPRTLRRALVGPGA